MISFFAFLGAALWWLFAAICTVDDSGEVLGAHQQWWWFFGLVFFAVGMAFKPNHAIPRR